MDRSQSQPLVATTATTTMLDVAAPPPAPAGDADSGRPNPTPIDLQIFLPWACRQLQAADEVLVTKVQQAEYVSVHVDKARRRSKSEKGFSVFEAVQSEMVAIKSSDSVQPADAENIKITVVHNAQDKCIHLKLLNNRFIPRMLLKILGLVIKFHTYLNMMTINAGVDMYTLHELSNLLPRSNITELCLDGAARPGLDLTLLLSQPNHLIHLSMARCKIDDNMVTQIAELITPPEPAGTKLKLLNLASNRITDLGARHLASALRTNRTLSYLNVSDNRIYDDGGAALLEVLVEFELTSEEIASYQLRLVQYLNQKFELLNKLKTKLKAAEGNAPRNRKSYKFEASIEQRAVSLLDGYLGSFSDPFGFTNTVRRGDRVYCKGNFTLAYLNVAYCNLHYVTLKRLVRVLESQRRRGEMARTGGGGAGLAAAGLEGNPLPRACAEYARLQALLGAAHAPAPAPAPRRMSIRRRPKSDESRMQ